MTHSHGRNLLVGLFVLLGLIGLGSLIILFGESPASFAGGTYPVTIYFKELPENILGSRILMNGQNIGRVEKITFREPTDPAAGMEVRTKIQNRYLIPVGSKALLVQPTVGFGSTRLIIQPGPRGPLLPKDGSAPLIGEVIGGLDTVLPATLLNSIERAVTQIGDLAEALAPAARDLHDLMEKRRPADVDQPDAEVLGNVSTAVQRLDDVLRTINEVLGDPADQNKLAQAIEDLRVASASARTAAESFEQLGAGLRAFPEDVKVTTGKINEFVDNMQMQVDRVAQVLVTDAETLGRVLNRLETVAREVEAGHGTLGKLLGDEELYEALVLTTKRLDATLVDLQVLIRKLQREGLIKGFGF